MMIKPKSPTLESYGSEFHCEKLSKSGAFSAPFFPVFGMNTGKFRTEKTPYLDIFHAVYTYYRLDSLSITFLRDASGH